MKLESFKFQDGKVFWLPEYPEKPNEKDFSGDQWKENNAFNEYDQAIAYSLASAIEVAPEDVEKIRFLIWSDNDANKTFPPPPSIRAYFDTWQPENGKVYNAECEVEKVYYCCRESGLLATAICSAFCSNEFRQVAHLKPKDEDYLKIPSGTAIKRAKAKLLEKAGRPEDFPWPAKKPENITGKWRVESSTSPIADTGDYFTQLWLTNGVVNLHSEKDDNETELQLIADQLNKDEIPAANSHDMKDEDL